MTIIAPIEINVDDLRGPEIAALLQRHLDHMYRVTPAGSVYALDLEKLRAPNITFWTAWQDTNLIGCVALKTFKIDGRAEGEIKSMHTPAELRGQGIAQKLVVHLIAEAKARGLTKLHLETGKTDAFLPAQKLYSKFGFVPSGPFADYGPDPHSFFMALDLDIAAQ